MRYWWVNQNQTFHHDRLRVFLVDKLSSSLAPAG